MPAALAQSFSAVGSYVSDSSFTVTVPNAIPVGSVLVLGTLRGANAGTNGVASITGAGANTWKLHVAHSARANNHDVSLHVLPVTQAIAAGTVLTIALVAPSTRKVVIGAVFTGLTGVVDATSGANVPGDFSVNVGANGSGTAVTATTGAVTVNNTLVVGINSLNGLADAACAGTEIREQHTAAGATERGLVMQYFAINAAGTKTASATLPASQVWTAAAIALPVTADTTGTPEPPKLGQVVVGGSKKTVANMSVVVGGVKKSVTSVSVIVGGAKRPLA